MGIERDNKGLLMGQPPPVSTLFWVQLGKKGPQLDPAVHPQCPWDPEDSNM